MQFFSGTLNFAPQRKVRAKEQTLVSQVLYDKIFLVFLGLQITETCGCFTIVGIIEIQRCWTQTWAGIGINEKVKVWTKFTLTSYLHLVTLFGQVYVLFLKNANPWPKMDNTKRYWWNCCLVFNVWSIDIVLSVAVQVQTWQIILHN